MLAELDKDTAIFLEHTQRPQCATLVTSFEDFVLLGCVVDFISLAESFAVAKPCQLLVSRYCGLLCALLYLLVDAQDEGRSHAAGSLNGLVTLLNVVCEGQHGRGGRPATCCKKYGSSAA